MLFKATEALNKPINTMGGLVRTKFGPGFVFGIVFVTSAVNSRIGHTAVGRPCGIVDQTRDAHRFLTPIRVPNGK